MIYNEFNEYFINNFLFIIIIIIELKKFRNFRNSRLLAIRNKLHHIL